MKWGKRPERRRGSRSLSPLRRHPVEMVVVSWSRVRRERVHVVESEGVRKDQTEEVKQLLLLTGGKRVTQMGGVHEHLFHALRKMETRLLGVPFVVLEMRLFSGLVRFDLAPKYVVHSRKNWRARVHLFAKMKILVVSKIHC